MADLTELQAAATTKIIGSDSMGIETNPLAVDSNGNIAVTQSGNWDVRNVTGTVSLPTGAATSAKQPNFGPAGTPSTDVLSIQGITSMTPLKVDGSGFTQPVSGTVAATQSGAWNITNITGSISLPTGAATETTLGGVLTTTAFQARVNTLGQKTMANSTPITIASDQTVIPVSQSTAAALSGAWPIKLTDGTNTMPTLDTASRSGFIRVTDGTNTTAVKAASTAAVAADPAVVVAISPNNGVKITDSTSANQLKVENTGAATVVLKDSAGQSLGTGENPIAVTASIGANKTFYSTSFTQLSTPARISSGTSGPFAVGNTTFTIAINGSSQNYAFPTRGAQAGFSLSGLDPSTSNANHKSIKVSVDGGATTQITIAQDLTSGAAIAAALQAAIRASVPNGSAVIVDWSISNTGRYTIFSGTTGTSSRVVITKGGDALAQDLKLGLAFGGTEQIGLAANSYRNSEVSALLTAGLNDVDAVLTTGGLVEIITRLGGASATLQVTAGGSNTALGYTTSLVTGTTGTGSAQLNVNGSSTSVRFGIDIPVGYSFTCSELLFLIRDANADVLKNFGGVAQLTNGLLVEYKTGDNPTGTLLTAKTNAELLAQCNEGSTFTDAYTDNSDLVSARITLVSGITLLPSSSDGIFITIRDNLTALDAFTVIARGFLEA